jgi:hypothetical protein
MHHDLVARMVVENDQRSDQLLTPQLIAGDQ